MRRDFTKILPWETSTGLQEVYSSEHEPVLADICALFGAYVRQNGFRDFRRMFPEGHASHTGARTEGSVVEQVTATRSELLARRSQIALATQGRDVLKEKRNQLMEEFRATVDVVISGSGALEAAAAEGRRALALAETGDGPEAVRSAGLAVPGQISLHARATTVMGVRIADIRYGPVGRSRTGRGYSLAGSSPRIDRVAEQFEGEISLLLELAIGELRLRRLVDEIGRTNRRVNALESVVLPRLERERAQIQGILDERERQERFRLKRFATRKGHRLEPSGEEG
jgi:V/A-type H+-transporting ATPase subunit D